MRAAWISALVIAGSTAALAEETQTARPWLGISISDTGARWGGIEVVDVFEDTPASLCGIRAGDEIFSIDRVEVHGTRELQIAVSAHKIGEKIAVEYVRGDTLRRCHAKLAEVVTDPTELIQRRVVDREIHPFLLERRSDGAMIDDATSRGEVLVLALISTACEACVNTLHELETAVAGTGAKLYAVHADSEEAADAFIQRTGVTVELAFEPAAGLVRRYLTDRDDATILLIDHEGIVRFAAVGTGLEAVNLDAAEFCAERAERARLEAR